MVPHTMRKYVKGLVRQSAEVGRVVLQRGVRETTITEIKKEDEEVTRSNWTVCHPLVTHNDEIRRILTKK